MQPLVSVIIPTYNRSEYLKDALMSAINQTYKNLEILVSDDFSPQSSQEIVNKLEDSRVIYHRNDHNLGMFQNTINTFQRAKGKYVASLNDDDMWNPEFISKLVEILEANPQVVVAFCDHYIVNADGNINLEETEINTKRWKRNQLKGGIYQPFYEIGLVNKSIAIAAAALIRKDALDWDNLSTQAGVFWDLFTTYMLCKDGAAAYYYPERLTRYRVHENSETAISGSRDLQAKIRKAQAGIFCYNTFKNNSNLKSYHPHFKKKIAEANTSLAIALLKNNQPQEARQYLLAALAEEQFNPRAIIPLFLSFMPSRVGNSIVNFVQGLNQ